MNRKGPFKDVKGSGRYIKNYSKLMVFLTAVLILEAETNRWSVFVIKYWELKGIRNSFRIWRKFKIETF